MSARAVIFDFDNTIMNMDTKIYLKHNKKDKLLSLTTKEYAKLKHTIGNSGPLLKYSLYNSSFKEFESCGNKNYFLEGICNAINLPHKKWKAFYFEYFLEMLSSQKSAENVYILSARAHSKEDFISGARILKSYVKKKYGKKIHLPRRENLFFVGDKRKIALAKAAVIESIVRKEAYEGSIEIEFADDDFENIQEASTLLNSLKSSFSSVSFVLSHVLNKGVKKFDVSKGLNN